MTIALAGAASALAPMQTAACTISIPIAVSEEMLSQEPLDYRDQCRAAARDPHAFVERFKAHDPYLTGEFERVARAMYEGSARCREQPAQALELVDAAIGSPVTLWPQLGPVEIFLEWTSDDAPTERRDEVRIGSWLTHSTRFGVCGYDSYADALPRGHSEAEVLEWLLRPEYWAIAVEQFGNNPARDRLILRQLIDPSSEKFDAGLAAQLAPRRRDNRRMRLPDALDVEIAEAVTDPRLGAPDYEVAAMILGRASLFSYTGITLDQPERTQHLWLRIMQSRLTHPNPEVRRDAAHTLRAKDAASIPSVSLAEALPEGAPVTILGAWPEGLAPINNLAWASLRIQDNYPSRALRKEQHGRVELGIVFAPDGRFHSIHVTRSAGEQLDWAAVVGSQRYLRPKIDEMVLTGYEGRYVYVPLPTLEYRFATVLDGLTERSYREGPIIVISAAPRVPMRY